MIRHEGSGATSSFRRALSLALLGAMAATACSSGGSNATDDRGTTGGGSTSGGSTGSSGGTSSGGSSSGASGSSGGSSGIAGSSTGGSSSGAGLGSEGGADGAALEGGGGEGGEGGEGGTTNCAGKALSLATNGFLTGTTGPNNDAAAARVDIDFGASCTDLPLANTFRTVEYWAYVFTNSWVGNANTMYFYGSTARPAHGFGLDFGTNAVNGNHATLDPYTNGGFDDDNQPSGLTTSMNQWVHFAMTWDGTAVRTFVNGVEKITATSDGSASNLSTDCSKVSVGGYEQDGNYFNGYIDEFRIWNVAHTAAQITATMHTTLMGNEAGLVNYLKFDETGGSTAADSVTTAGHMAHNGTLNSANGNPPTFIPSTAPINCP